MTRIRIKSRINHSPSTSSADSEELDTPTQDESRTFKESLTEAELEHIERVKEMGKEYLRMAENRVVYDYLTVKFNAVTIELPKPHFAEIIEPKGLKKEPGLEGGFFGNRRFY